MVDYGFYWNFFVFFSLFLFISFPCLFRSISYLFWLEQTSLYELPNNYSRRINLSTKTKFSLTSLCKKKFWGWKSIKIVKKSEDELQKIIVEPFSDCGRFRILFKKKLIKDKIIYQLILEKLKIQKLIPRTKNFLLIKKWLFQKI